MVTIEGRAALKRKLQAMPRAVREEIAKALEQSGAELSGLAKRLAPRKTGRLADSIRYEIEDDLRVTVSAGDKEAFYAAMVEHGTKPHENKGRFKGSRNPGTRARPFFFPAYRALKKRIKTRLSRSITKGIKKAAK